MVGMADIVRSMTAQQLTKAYDRGAVSHAEYVAALDYQRREARARVASGKAPAQLLDLLDDRMTDRDGQAD